MIDSVVSGGVEDQFTLLQWDSVCSFHKHILHMGFACLSLLGRIYFVNDGETGC